MHPVRVSFTLRTPMVIPPGAKHFDALMSWAATRQAEFDGHPLPWDTQHDIGIEKHHVGDQWCFKASAVEIEWIGERDKIHYIKQQRIENHMDAYLSGVLDKRPAFNAASGPTKAGSYIEPIRWVKTVTAYAVVNDMGRFESLLPWITHIGKLHHRDYGAVSSFEVTPDEAAESLWMRRNLPMGSAAGEAHAQAMGALVSPYWKRENHRPILAYAG